MSFYFTDIPGWKEAIARAKENDFQTREDNWLALTRTIGGVKVRTMLVRDYVALLRSKSPFLYRVEPNFYDITFFLWVLSPEINLWHEKTGWRKQWLFPSLERWQAFWHARRCRRLFKLNQLERAAAMWNAANPDKPYEVPENSPIAQMMTSCFKYIDLIFQDKPAALESKGIESGLFYLTAWFDIMQSEYKLSTDEIWTMPIPVLFARLAAIRARKNPANPNFNPKTDELKKRVMDALNSKQITEDELKAGRFEFN